MASALVECYHHRMLFFRQRANSLQRRMGL